MGAWVPAVLTDGGFSLLSESWGEARNSALIRLFHCRDAINGAGPITGHQQRPVGCNRPPHRPSVNVRLGRIRHHTGHDRHRIGRRLAVLERHKRNLVSRARRPVARAMFGDECTTAVTLRKLLPGVKRKLQWRHMRAKQYVRNDRARNQVWLLRLYARINVFPDVAVRPPVESSILQRGEIVRRKIVSQFVPLVNGRPDFARYWFDRQTHWIPESRCIAPRILPVEIAHRYGSAPRVFSRVYIRFRADRDEQALPVRRKGQRSRIVSARW